MKLSKIGLALVGAAWLALSAAAAPAPLGAPESQGPITDALRLRALLPKTAPPLGCPATLVEEGVLKLERRTATYVSREVMEKVQTPGGSVKEVRRIITEMVPQATEVRVEAKSCKFFVVTKDGKLEPMDAAKATATLKKTTAVLAGETADVDPRNLEVIKPGTLYIVLPAPELIPQTPPPPLEKPFPKP